MSTSTLVEASVESSVATLTLNEPESRNPLSPGLVTRLLELLHSMRDDDDVRAVILTGAGKGFSAGADLRRMRAATAWEDRVEYGDILELNRTVWRYPKPTLAAVHGFALGAGANLMAWCDIAVIDESAVVGYPEVRAGVPSATVIPSLSRMVSRKALYQLVLTGRPIPAAEALRIGLVSRVSGPGAALSDALDIARAIAANDAGAVALTKQIVQTTTDMAYDEAIEYAKEVRVISRLRSDFAVRVPQGGAHDD